MTQWFSIARVLPERLSLNGSSASAEILAATLRHMGHEVSIVDVHGPEDAPGTVDIVTVGSGSTSQIAPAATDLISLVRVFQSWKASGSAWVAVGTGWDLLGEALITAGVKRCPVRVFSPPRPIIVRDGSPVKCTGLISADGPVLDISTRLAPPSSWETLRRS